MTTCEAISWVSQLLIDQLLVLLHPVCALSSDKTFWFVSLFWILQRLPLPLKYPESFKNYLFKQHFKWKWILTFCALLEFLWCIATHLVCSFGEEETPQAVLAHWPSAQAWIATMGLAKESLVRCRLLLQSQSREFLPLWEVFTKNWSSISSFSLFHRGPLVLEDKLEVLNWPSEVSLSFDREIRKSPFLEQVYREL